MAGNFERPLVNLRVGFAVPDDVAAQLFIEICERAGTGFGSSATNDDAVGIEAVHYHASTYPALQLGNILLRARPFSFEAGTCHMRYVFVLTSNEDSARFEHGSILLRPEESDRRSKRSQCFDSRISGGNDRVPALTGKTDMAELAFHGLGGARRVGDENDEPPFTPPLPQSFLRARLQSDAVMDHAPKIAQDKLEPRRKLVPECRGRGCRHAAHAQLQFAFERDLSATPASCLVVNRLKARDETWHVVQANGIGSVGQRIRRIRMAFHE